MRLSEDLGVKLKIDDKNSNETYSLDRRPRTYLELSKIQNMQKTTKIGIHKDGKNIPIKRSLDKSFTGKSFSGVGSDMAVKKSDNLYPG